MTEFNGDGFLQALGWATMSSFWQVGLLWIFYLTLGYFVILKAKQKYWLAVLGVLLSFAFFVITFCLYYFKGITPFIHFITDTLSPGNNVISFVLIVCSTAYLLALPFPFYRIFICYRFTQSLKRNGLEIAPIELRLFVNKLSQILNIKTKVNLFVSTLISSPLTIGFLKPIILLPLASINNLNPLQLEAILLHELSHIKRYDYLINIVINLVRTLLYFNPFVKKFALLAEEQREIISDELVLQFGYNSVNYASALFQMQKAVHQKGLFTLLAAGKKFLLMRIKRIVGEEREIRHKFHPSFFVLISMVLSCFLLLHLKMEFRPNKNTIVPSLAISSKIIVETKGFKKVELQNFVSNNKHFKEDIKKKQRTINGKRKKNNELVLNENSVNNYVEQPLELQKVAFIKTIIEADDKQKVLKATLIKTKALLQTIEWKEIELEIADAMNEKEIELLKSIYNNELNQVDWEHIENDLKAKYDDDALLMLNENLNRLIFNLIPADQLNVMEDNLSLEKLESNIYRFNNYSPSSPIPVYLNPPIEHENPLLKLHQLLDSLQSTHNRNIIRL